MTDFYVTLKPLEPYFFGSERKLGDGTGEIASSYFIRSEYMPQQATLLGMIRFFLLKQSGSIRDDYQIDEKLIGKDSFTLSNKIFDDCSGGAPVGADTVQDFGVIKGISPLFLADQEERYYMATPKNHQKGKALYTPYEMIEMYADGRNGSCLLKDYNGKTGITDSYTRLCDHRIFETQELFGKTENVGIYKKSEEEGYYKKEYKYLKTVKSSKDGMAEKSLLFAFFLTLEDDSEVMLHKLPHFLKEKCTVKDVVYMGLGKSAFYIEIKKKENDFYSQAADLVKRNCQQEWITYYTVSDTLFLEQPDLPFAIIDTGSFRYLMTKATKGGKKDYWGRRQKSSLHHVVRPGSMFWVKRDGKEIFESKFNIGNCKKIGMNQLIGSES